MDMQVMYCANAGGGAPSTTPGGATAAYYRLMLNGYGVYQPPVATPTPTPAVGSAMDMLPCLPNMDLSYLWPFRLGKKTKSVSKVECKVCSITLNSETQAKQHFNGKNHLKRLKQMGLLPGGDDDNENGDSKSDGDKPSTSSDSTSDDKSESQSENPTSTTSNEQPTNSDDEGEKSGKEDEADEEQKDEVTKESDDEMEEIVQREEADASPAGVESPVLSVSSETSVIEDTTANQERAGSVSSQESVISEVTRPEVTRDSPMSHTSTESIGSGLRREVYQRDSPISRTSAERIITTSSLNNLQANHLTRATDFIGRREPRMRPIGAGYSLQARPQSSLLGAPRSAVLEQPPLPTPSFFVPPTATTSHPRLPFPPTMGAQPTVPIIPFPSTAAPSHIGAPNMVYANYSNQISPAQDSMASLAQNRLYYGQEQILAGHNTGYQQQMILQQSLVSIPGAHTGLPPGAITKNQPALSSANTPPRLALPSPPIAPQISPDHKMDPVSQAIYDNFMGKLPNKRKMELTCDTTDHSSGFVKRFRTVADVRNGLNPAIVNLGHS